MADDIPPEVYSNSYESLANFKIYFEERFIRNYLRFDGDPNDDCGGVLAEYYDLHEGVAMIEMNCVFPRDYRWEAKARSDMAYRLYLESPVLRYVTPYAYKSPDREFRRHLVADFFIARRIVMNVDRTEEYRRIRKMFHRDIDLGQMVRLQVSDEVWSKLCERDADELTDASSDDDVEE